MLYIAHRGNLFGPNKLEENKPEYIKKALQQGFMVEVDVWEINGLLFSGHDNPSYHVPLNIEYNENIIFHCKNEDALFRMEKNKRHFFFHNKDDYTLTSKGYIWAYPGKKVNEKCILVLPENNFNNLKFIPEIYPEIKGICSDYIYELKNSYQSLKE